jgi:hypothetical protein
VIMREGWEIGRKGGRCVYNSYIVADGQ